jgi:hypothetical protein
MAIRASQVRRKKYTLNRDSEILTPLEKLVLALTDTEIKKPSETVRKVSADINVRHTEHGVEEAAKRLIKKGLVTWDDQIKQH